jgi:hypothetical protein
VLILDAQQGEGMVDALFERFMCERTVGKSPAMTPMCGPQERLC